MKEKSLKLPEVTLVGFAFNDQKYLDSLYSAFCTFNSWLKCKKTIIFHTCEVDLNKYPEFKNVTFEKLVNVKTMQDYSRFVIKELYKFFDTKHCMVFQDDGFPVNQKAWDPSFLNFDYIGAPWWYKDDLNVGNGGFCIRSKKLCMLAAEIIPEGSCHSEDDTICRKYGKQLKDLGILYAPQDVAEKFSVEYSGLYSGQFGFHSKDQAKIVLKYSKENNIGSEKLQAVLKSISPAVSVLESVSRDAVQSLRNKTSAPEKQKIPTKLPLSNRVVYYLNSTALGDLMAAAPAVKWAVDTFHSETDYRVGLWPEFREIFHFIPDDKIIKIGEDAPEGFSKRLLNTPGVGNNICRLTPSRIKLTDYATVNLLGRTLPHDKMRYVPLKEADISKYGIDFKNTVVIITTYRDKHRAILSQEILKIAENVHARGLVPVFVGQRGKIAISENVVSDFEYPGFGVDLRDKTTLSELATIMAKCKAVVGMDSGPMHLAFSTQTPVACGFTSVRPELRVPYRGESLAYSITPRIFCKFCQSDWQLDYWGFSKCPRQLDLPECTQKMNAPSFIDALEKMSIFDEV